MTNDNTIEKINEKNKFTKKIYLKNVYKLFAEFLKMLDNSIY